MYADTRQTQGGFALSVPSLDHKLLIGLAGADRKTLEGSALSAPSPDRREIGHADAETLIPAGSARSVQGRGHKGLLVGSDAFLSLLVLARVNLATLSGS